MSVFGDSFSRTVGRLIYSLFGGGKHAMSQETKRRQATAIAINTVDATKTVKILRTNIVVGNDGVRITSN